MKRKMVPFFVLTVATIGLLFNALTAQADPIAHLTLHSEPGDYIGRGGDFDITYTPENSDFFFVFIFYSPPRFLEFQFGTVTSGLDNTFATLQFSTNQLGIPIQPGFYPDAERAPFASPGHAGLVVSFQNRGCNTLTGNFTIDDVTFLPDPSLQSGLNVNTFDASFEQHCEGNAPALFGTFSFNAGAAAVPEPATSTLVTSGLLLLMAFRKRK